MSEEIVSLLTSIGLNKYEAKAYIALLIRGIATASEISDLSGIPYTRVYDVLSSLESKGFIVSVPGRPMKFQALDPDIALRNLLELHKQKVLSELQVFERNAKKALETLSRLKPGSREYEKIICLRGKVSIMNFIRQLIRRASRNIIEIRTSSAPKIISKDMLNEIKKEEINISTITIGAKDENNQITLVIIDDIVVMYEPHENIPETMGEYDRAIIIQSKPLANILLYLVSTSQEKESNSS
ncbi:TrmB family transcriptional regulator [Desulfurococcaceae archaeon MEX13E-LK6-19]|nr:TrmB family transcriptional regulator [Desulfurococcaceae archaeon MEX13E-LK6-19]